MSRQVCLITTHFHDQSVKRVVGEIELMGMMGIHLSSSKVREISLEKISIEEAQRLEIEGKLDDSAYKRLTTLTK